MKVIVTIILLGQTLRSPRPVQSLLKNVTYYVMLEFNHLQS